MENNITDILQKYFFFLLNDFNFKAKGIERYDYALYAKFISPKVGVYFIFEYRDFVPQLQFTFLNGEDLKARPGLYTLKELYKNENFKLQSFYLDEILLFRGQGNYKGYFENSKTIEEAIKISAELAVIYALDFLNGDSLSYEEMDQWFRKKVI
jgi:hypothetical protein